MNSGLVAVLLAAGFLVVAVASGPLTPLDLTPASHGPLPGTGTANVTDAALPTGGITLERTRFGAGTYRLAGPPATASVGSVTGNPTLVFVVDLPGLGVGATCSVDLDGRAQRSVSVGYDTVEISPKTVTRDAYDATISIWLDERGGAQVQLVSRRVTVEVDR